jgi:hypothetical protein
MHGHMNVNFVPLLKHTYNSSTIVLRHCNLPSKSRYNRTGRVAACCTFIPVHSTGTRRSMSHATVSLPTTVVSAILTRLNSANPTGNALPKDKHAVIKGPPDPGHSTQLSRRSIQTSDFPSTQLAVGVSVLHSDIRRAHTYTARTAADCQEQL